MATLELLRRAVFNYRLQTFLDDKLTFSKDFSSEMD